MSGTADIRRAPLVAVSCALAGLVAPVLPVIGVPLAALGLSALWSSGRRVFALGAVGAAVGLLALQDPGAALFTAVALAASGPFAAYALTRTTALRVAVVLSVMLFVALAASQAVTAMESGRSLSEDIRASSEEVVALATQAVGAQGEDAQALQEAGELLVAIWPAMTFQIAALTALFAAAAAGVGASRLQEGDGEAASRMPRLGSIDLSVHVVWMPVMAVAALAFAGFGGPGWLYPLGLNALLVARVPLAVQGFAVFAATLDKMGMRGSLRSLSYVLLAFVEVVTYAITLVGLIDFWANFRRLPRDGVTPAGGALEEQGPRG